MKIRDFNAEDGTFTVDNKLWFSNIVATPSLRKSVLKVKPSLCNTSRLKNWQKTRAVN
ncbi:hypothetical protein OK016_05235 [Vibrio chagasii]|nr:hypothetical protein [Vibrio chagasii]